jgi:hypothetical protein
MPFMVVKTRPQHPKRGNIEVKRKYSPYHEFDERSRFEWKREGNVFDALVQQNLTIPFPFSS